LSGCGNKLSDTGGGFGVISVAAKSNSAGLEDNITTDYVIFDDQNSESYENYKLGSDIIPSITSIVGDRLCAESDTEVIDGVTVMTIRYETDPDDKTQAANDVAAYFNYLIESEGFVSLVTFDTLPYEGGVDMRFAKNSNETGEIIILTIEYDYGGYILQFQKGEGTLEIFDDNPPEPIPPTTEPPPPPTTEAPKPPPTTEGPKPPPTTEAPKPTNPPTTEPPPKPTDPPAPTNTLTADVIKTLASGTFYMKMKGLSGEMAGIALEMYAKNNMVAMLMQESGIDFRIVVRNGITYTIIDDYQMMSTAATAEGDSFNIGGESELIFVNTGSGSFNGKTYKYDEYTDKNGSKYFYYMDGNSLKGLRTIEQGMATDVEIYAFDKNVPDSFFNIPLNYEAF
jgi:hypothetical protein